jgi:hypothetical protein
MKFIVERVDVSWIEVDADDEQEAKEIANDSLDWEFESGELVVRE